VTDDKRLIEDYLPIEKISTEASREKLVRKGHISTLHLWWARRPLVACRAAVYGALVPASRFVPNGASDEKKKSLGRANAAKFVERLCQYPGSPSAIAEAQTHILEAHAERLTQDTGKKVTADDIVKGNASRPKVLDMFAGGGAIPLEALRLGCDAYALDLNPVAHIIELCTLVYPQKYGKPDRNNKGSAKDGTWAGLSEEVRFWGNWVLKKVQAEIGDLYAPIPDPIRRVRQPLGQAQLEITGKGFERTGQQKLAVETPEGYLTPVAYLWTRTVRCKNPLCGATVPLVKQTWLCKKVGRFVALRIMANKGKKNVRFEVVEARDDKGLGFDPEAFSKGGNATCPFCETVADVAYVKEEGWGGRLGLEMMAAVYSRQKRKADGQGGSMTGKVYISADDLPSIVEDGVTERIKSICGSKGLRIPSAPIAGLPDDSKENTVGTRVRPYGFRTWGQMFTPRQTLCLLTFVAAVRESETEIRNDGYQPDHAMALLTYLGAMVDKLADFCSTECVWNYTGGRGVKNSFGRQALTMTWDFSETNPFNEAGASWVSICEDTPAAIDLLSFNAGPTSQVSRGSATNLHWSDATFDAVITDPPYYDNVPYADISDFFYVWLRQTVGHLYPEHFATEGTPKKGEAIAEPTRHGGNRDKARRAYENMMAEAFREAHRVLKPNGHMTVVYAHKTTLGWATLVDALRQSGFTVTEAWPLDTEMKARLRGMDAAALASSIFLFARKRDGSRTGCYEDEVRPDLERIVRERVETLWEMGISGADLVIACVGAGLRAFTRFAKVEYANGEEVPAQRFLTEVETVVLESILRRLSKEVGANGGKYGLVGLDGSTRFYVLWRYTYQTATLDAGEAIVFANGTHVELDGMQGLSSGARQLVEKKKGSYHLLDYTERGDGAKLGMPSDDGQPAPLIDSLHRLLWLLERNPSRIGEFLREARPNTEQLRLLAQALSGPALKGSELGEVASGTELAALVKLTANWRSVVEDAAEAGPLFRSAELKK
jgi:putative DNA methylase